MISKIRNSGNNSWGLTTSLRFRVNFSIVIVGRRTEKARGTREDNGGEQQKNRRGSEEISELSFKCKRKKMLAYHASY